MVSGYRIRTGGGKFWKIIDIDNAIFFSLHRYLIQEHILQRNDTIGSMIGITTQWPFYKKKQHGHYI